MFYLLFYWSKANREHRRRKRITRLIQQLWAKDPNDRRHACRTLAYYGTSAMVATPHLILLLGDRDPSVSKVAGETLAQFQATAFLLAQELLTDSDRRPEAANTLVMIGEAALPQIVRIGMSHIPSFDHETALLLLTTLKRFGVSAISALASLVSSENEHISDMAAERLAFHGRAALPSIKRELHHAKYGAATKLAKLAARCGDEGVGFLIELLCNDFDRHLTNAASAGLSIFKTGKEVLPLPANLPYPQLVPALLRDLENSDVPFRVNVIWLLGQLYSHCPDYLARSIESAFVMLSSTEQNKDVRAAFQQAFADKNLS